MFEVFLVVLDREEVAPFCSTAFWARALLASPASPVISQSTPKASIRASRTSSPSAAWASVVVTAVPPRLSPSPGNDDLEAPRFGLFGIRKEQVGGAVGRNHPHLVGHLELLQRLRGVLHGLPVRLGAHDDANQGIGRKVHRGVVYFAPTLRHKPGNKNQHPDSWPLLFFKLLFPRVKRHFSRNEPCRNVLSLELG